MIKFIKKIIKDFKELIQVLRDRCWFYYVIDGNEFHPSLSLDIKKCMKSNKHYLKEIDRITRERARAHKLDNIFNRLGMEDI